MKAFLIKGLAAAVAAACVYAAAGVAIGFFGLQRAVRNAPSVRGGYGHTLVRFQEIKDVQHVSILFAGSSHAYRGFDTAFFTSRGHSCYNIGSSMQTALNTYFILKRVLRTLSCDTLVLEVYWRSFNRKGEEATIDLVSNCEPGVELAAMALATRDLLAMNAWLTNTGAQWRRPLALRDQRSYPDDQYVPGGYVSSTRTNTHVVAGSPEPPTPVTLSNWQLHFLGKTLAMCRRKGIEVILVRAPVPAPFLQQVSNYADTVTPLADLARQYGYPFWDFADEAEFYDSHSDYYDAHHLNADGVRKFNERFLRRFHQFGELGVGPSSRQETRTAESGD